MIKKDETAKKTIKKPVKKPVVKKTVKKPVRKEMIKPVKNEVGVRIAENKTESISATGKRKNAIAQIRFFPQGQGEISINKKEIKKYFPVAELQELVLSPLKLVKKEREVDLNVKVMGGGVHSQAEATRLGISRALISLNPDWRKELKTAGFLRRDSRKKERKKPGLKRARRAPQWAKR